MHAWRHEAWGGLDAAGEDAIVARGRAAFGALGIDGVTGFRPPGGAVNPATADVLARHGFTWCSPEGDRRARDGAIATVPFAWSLVDAYHRLDAFGARRAEHGDPETPLTPDAAAGAILDRLAAGATPTLILHPFLMVEDDGWAATRRVLRAIAGGDAAVGPAGTAAAALR
jgi:peptidoglycan/xylan/chitin deacetylase (PgdA/CDA1 family)